MGDVYEPDYKSYQKTRAFKLYRNFLLDDLGRDGIDAEQAARNTSYETTAAQQRAASDQARRGAAAIGGGNNVSGQLGGLLTQLHQQSPYQRAAQEATQVGKQSMHNTGQAWQNLKQSQANLYSTLVQPYLTQQQIDQQAAGMAAGAGGGFDWTSMIGPALGASAALLM